jgi:hypothetical protein
MKYNILTIASKSYYPFLDIFLNSLLTNADQEKINKIYVVLVDFGDYKNELVKSEKIIYIDDSAKDEFNGVHSDGWYKNTKMKTHHLRDVLELIPTDESLILIDSDVLVLEDFSDIINKEFDIQITEMSDGSHISASQVEILHIACFMIFNDITKSKKFLNKWIDNTNFLISNERKKPHETPAMNLTIQDLEFMREIKIQSLDDRIVCSDLKIFDNTRVLHFKSLGTNTTTPLQNFLSRLKYVRCFTEKYKNLSFEKYITLDSFKKWTEDDCNVNINDFFKLPQKYK